MDRSAAPADFDKTFPTTSSRTARSKRAYLTENTELLEKFGVALDSDLTLVGGESLFPKITDTVAELVLYFEGTADMQDMTSDDDNYLGQPDQRYLKLGWAWAKDLVDNAGTEAEEALVLAVTTHTEILDPFITTLPVDGFLGDPLVEEEHEDKYGPLLALCQAFVPVMIERAQRITAMAARYRIRIPCAAG
jgi:hypothetical protein